MDTYLNIPNLNKTLQEADFENIIEGIVLQLYEYGFDNIINDYNSKLKDPVKDWNDLCKKKVLENYISSTSQVGLSIIKRHMTHIYEVQSHKGVCIKDLWTKDNIEKAVRLNRRTHSTPYISEIIRQLGFMSGTSKVTIYRPLLTKRIVEYFNARSVLDVCVGWGGRMIGSLCVPGVEYTGIEPFSKTYSGLCNILTDIDLINNPRVRLYNDVAENVLPGLNDEQGNPILYDIALTSPPYYNLEIYSDENTQSHHYGSYEDWYNQFLKPVVFGVLDHLKPDGKSCWSVKNFKTDKAYDLYDDIVSLHEERGWVKMDVEFYIGNSTRPGLKDKNGNAMKNKEITFVFQRI